MSLASCDVRGGGRLPCYLHLCSDVYCAHSLRCIMAWAAGSTPQTSRMHLRKKKVCHAAPDSPTTRLQKTHFFRRNSPSNSECKATLLLLHRRRSLHDSLIRKVARFAFKICPRSIRLCAPVGSWLPAPSRTVAPPTARKNPRGKLAHSQPLTGTRSH